ncbi:hypothetical protein SAMN02745218_01145 [Desulfofundulus australicus DSM 11792]|uniref:Uncharacterized protein n=1 Tax=Desulfofundulus australicus DSM 11792 TaxID=1121425 RepID=A0A1M4XRW2_9FIRM|nr:hypothetical protein [Desulfofundulus australicus]SHE96185.1 hypothetical protein SAMN02745218_01145 [Desulfofundulus australicus DSM 11792]
MNLLARAFYNLEEALEEGESAREQVEVPIEEQDGATALIIQEDDLKGVLKIVVDGYLPRTRHATSMMRRSWIGKITRALLPIDVHFEKAFCIIVIYVPGKVNWDVDNRYYKFIIDAIRFARIIDDDNCQRLSFMVIGGVDPENPRTEIYIVNQPFEEHVFVYKLLKHIIIEGKSSG